MSSWSPGRLWSGEVQPAPAKGPSTANRCWGVGCAAVTSVQAFRGLGEQRPMRLCMQPAACHARWQKAAAPLAAAAKGASLLPVQQPGESTSHACCRMLQAPSVQCRQGDTQKPAAAYLVARAAELPEGAKASAQECLARAAGVCPVDGSPCDWHILHPARGARP